MKPSRELLRRVIKKSITPTELVAEIRSLAPVSAKNNTSHPWWQVEAAELLDVIAKASTGNVHLAVADAVAEARRTRGRVVVERIAGVVLYRVMPVVEAEIVVTDKIVSEAFPAEMVDPPFDETLPSLDTFRRLAERQYVQRLLGKHDFNITASAAEAGVSRQCFYALLQRHSITRPGATEHQQEPQRRVA